MRGVTTMDDRVARTMLLEALIDHSPISQNTVENTVGSDSRGALPWLIHQGLVRKDTANLVFEYVGPHR